MLFVLSILYSLFHVSNRFMSIPPTVRKLALRTIWLATTKNVRMGFRLHPKQEKSPVVGVYSYAWMIIFHSNWFDEGGEW